MNEDFDPNRHSAPIYRPPEQGSVIAGCAIYLVFLILVVAFSLSGSGLLACAFILLCAGFAIYRLTQTGWNRTATGILICLLLTLGLLLLLISICGGMKF